MTLSGFYAIIMIFLYLTSTLINGAITAKARSSKSGPSKTVDGAEISLNAARIGISIAHDSSRKSRSPSASIDSTLSQQPSSGGRKILGLPLGDSDFEKGDRIFARELKHSHRPLPNLKGRPDRFQGDLVNVNLSNLEDIMRRVTYSNGKARNAINRPNGLWPNAVIPYTISANYTDDQRARLAAAMAAFHTYTCVRFMPRMAEKDYIHIHPGDGCSSTVGRAKNRQEVSLARGCLRPIGIIIHELMHTLGFVHEQMRTDRDKYVNIYESNIKPGMKEQFKIIRWTKNMGFKYDYRSVLHYGPRAFSKNGNYTMLPKEPGIRIGGRWRGFSTTDVAKINRLYNCPDRANNNNNNEETSINTGVVDGDSGDGSSGNANNIYENDNSNKVALPNDNSYVTNNAGVAPGDGNNFDGGESDKGAWAGTPLTDRFRKARQCVDKNIYCLAWAELNYCARFSIYSPYMRIYCRFSCNLCKIYVRKPHPQTGIAPMANLPIGFQPNIQLPKVGGLLRFRSQPSLAPVSVSKDQQALDYVQQQVGSRSEHLAAQPATEQTQQRQSVKPSQRKNYKKPREKVQENLPPVAADEPQNTEASVNQADDMLDEDPTDLQRPESANKPVAPQKSNKETLKHAKKKDAKLTKTAMKPKSPTQPSADNKKKSQKLAESKQHTKAKHRKEPEKPKRLMNIQATDTGTHKAFKLKKKVKLSL